MKDIALWQRVLIWLVCAGAILLALPNLFYARVEQSNDARASIAAGITHMGFGRFLAISLGGRLVRFGVLAAAPALIRAWWP